VSTDLTGPVLARARLRRDVPAQALARLLVPEQAGAQLGAAHSVVWALFADGPDRRRDFLWRQVRPGEFLILAARPPADPHGLFTLEYKPFAPALHPGQHLGFDLRANPVVGISTGSGQRGKRHDVVMNALSKLRHDERGSARDRATREAGLVWLERRGTSAAFTVDPDQLAIDGYDRVRIAREGDRAIIFSTLSFQGVLTVQDPTQFIAAVLRGFGAAKAFGCGLMLIKRVRS
jgi:CRISPR system Cascade subunit CasE